MDSLPMVFTLLLGVSLVLAIASLFTPRFAFPFTVKTKMKGISFWLGMGVVFFTLIGVTVPKQQDSKEIPPQSAGTPLPYAVLEKKETVRVSTKRNRLDVTIVPTGDQSSAAQADFAATVKAAAKRFQEESGLPVVTVDMIAQKSVNAWGEARLAVVSYIPDKKGYNGKQNSGPWDNLMAVERGFTAQELHYLNLWAEMRSMFQKGGQTDEEALDAAISKKINVQPGSLHPFSNHLSKVE